VGQDSTIQSSSSELLRRTILNASEAACRGEGFRGQAQSAGGGSALRVHFSQGVKNAGWLFERIPRRVVSAHLGFARTCETEMCRHDPARKGMPIKIRAF
jgi:hypothetical protein